MKSVMRIYEDVAAGRLTVEAGAELLWQLGAAPRRRRFLVALFVYFFAVVAGLIFIALIGEA